MRAIDCTQVLRMTLPEWLQRSVAWTSSRMLLQVNMQPGISPSLMIALAAVQACHACVHASRCTTP